jgi:hopanoid biosynthesis associated radical SAM protein HpnH
VSAIRAARKAGFRVTTNSTLFSDADPERYRRFFDEVMTLGVEGMMISPGYSYSKAPDQEHFLRRERSQSLFRRILDRAPTRWKFNQSPVFLEFLKGAWSLECRPWGTPTYNLFGWQRPCYLLDEGYAASFAELMEQTDWDAYGRASGNPKCQDCMVHCGYEPAAVEATFASLGGLLATARLMLLGPPASRPEASPPPSPAPQLAANGLPVLPILDRVA